MAELKKCPFCGGEAYSYKSKSLLGEMFWGIECESNECIVHTMIAEYPTKEKAIEQWNNRVTEAEIRNKAIDEFAEKISLEISESIIWDMVIQAHRDGNCSEISEEIVDYVIDTAKRVAEQLKGE